MFKTVFSFLTICLFLTLFCGNSEAAVITLKAESEVSAGLIRLGDIAVIHEQNATTLERLQKLSIGPAPAAGQTTSLPWTTIRSRLAVQGFSSAQVEFAGSSVVVVKSGAQVSTSPVITQMQFPSRFSLNQTEALETSVKQALITSLSKRFPEVASMTVSLTIPRADYPKIQGALRANYELIGGQPPWNRAQAILIRYQDEQDVAQTIPVICKFERRPYLLVTSHTLPAGHIIGQNDLVWKQMEATSEEAMTRPNDVLGMKTRRGLKQFSTITARDIQTVKLIRPNQEVTVLSRFPGLSIHRKMKARTAGGLGEQITLTIPETRETVTAKVVGPGLAEVISARQSQRSEPNSRIGSIQFHSETPASNSQRSSEPQFPVSIQPRTILPASAEQE